MNSFPKTAMAFEASTTAPLIQRLSSSLMFLPCGRRSDELLAHNREVNVLVPALLALPKFDFGALATPSSPDDEFDGFAFKKKKSQKAVKKSRQTWTQSLPDRLLFVRSGLFYPKDKREVKDLEDHILDRVRDILQVRISLKKRCHHSDGTVLVGLPGHLAPFGICYGDPPRLSECQRSSRTPSGRPRRSCSSSNGGACQHIRGNRLT